MQNRSNTRKVSLLCLAFVHRPGLMVAVPSPMYGFHCWGEGGITFFFLVTGKGDKRMEKIFMFLKQLDQEMTDSTCHMDLHSLANSYTTSYRYKRD